MDHGKFIRELMATESESEAMHSVIKHHEALERREFIKQASIVAMKALILKDVRNEFTKAQTCISAKIYAETLADEVLSKCHQLK